MTCPTCGAIVVDGAAFCMKCGAALKVPEATCKWCQRHIPAEAAYCPHCRGDQCLLVLDREVSEALRLNFEDSGFRTAPLNAYELSILPELDIPFHPHEHIVFVLPNRDSVKKVKRTFNGKSSWTFPYACLRWVVASPRESERGCVVMTNARFIIFALKEHRVHSIFFGEITTFFSNPDSESLDPFLLAYAFRTHQEKFTLNIETSEPEDALYGFEGLMTGIAPGISKLGRRVSKKAGLDKPDRPGRIQNRALVYMTNALVKAMEDSG